MNLYARHLSSLVNVDGRLGNTVSNDADHVIQSKDPLQIDRQMYLIFRETS